MSVAIVANWPHLLDVVRVLVRRDFVSRYRNTALGFLWALVSPLLFLAVFYFVFGVVLKMGIAHYASFVLIGVLSWSWFQAALVQAVHSITGNANFISQPGFPTIALPVVAVASTFLTFLIALPLLVGFLVIEGARPAATIVLLPAVMLIQAVLTLALAYAVAALNVGLRDVQYVIPVVLQLGYYVTPIFYSPAHAPERLRGWLSLNPMYDIIDAYRTILLGSGPINWSGLIVILLGALCTLCLTFVYFRRCSERFLEEL